MAKKNKIEIIRRSKKVEFWYKGEFFIYEYHKDSNGGTDFIYRGSKEEKIWGPYDRDCTDEGRKIYHVLHEKLHHKKT